MLMGSSPNGDQISPNYKAELFWEFHDEKNNEDNDYGNLKGKIYIKEGNYQKGIQIEGIQKKNNEEIINFYYDGVFIKRKNNEMYYKIKYNDNSKFKFPKEIIMRLNDEKNHEIIGDIFFGDKPLKLKLLLYLPKNAKDKPNISIDNYQYTPMKLIKPVDKISNSRCGMVNLFNTCYMNSSFQILLHIPQLIEIILENKDFEHNIIGNINYTLEMILEKYSERRPVINPSIFVDNFKNQHLEYSGHSQKDTEMFLEDLIADINTQLSVLDKRIMHHYSLNTEKEKLYYKYIEETERDSYFQINDLFYVCFVHEKQCYSCKYISYYFDEATGLKLNFEKTRYQKTIDIKKLIMNNFLKPIHSNSSFPCKNCKKSYKFIENTKIAKLPKILILSLQKTDIESNKKLPWLVEFNEKKSLDINELVDTELYYNGNCSYSLFAINNHIGSSTKSGHYYSLIYLEAFKKWYSFNDEDVLPASDISPNLYNYILFYKQNK